MRLCRVSQGTSGPDRAEARRSALRRCGPGRVVADRVGPGLGQAAG
ncbi:hypothetical protein ACRAWD_26880 [Caulobacter segnis]